MPPLLQGRHYFLAQPDNWLREQFICNRTHFEISDVFTNPITTNNKFIYKRIAIVCQPSVNDN